MTEENEIRRYNDGVFTWEKAVLADECRVDIHLNGCRLASVMASPTRLDELALGFLFGEGLVDGPEDVVALEVEDLTVRIETRGRARARRETATLADLEDEAEAIFAPPAPPMDAARILAYMGEFNTRSHLFRQTGAVHSCCLINGDRRFFADDVGRHNALDKVIGQYLAAGRLSGPVLVLTTGRISVEILLKSVKAGAALLISRGAATDRAVELARRLNLVLIGFARETGFNVYHGGERLIDAPARD